MKFKPTSIIQSLMVATWNISMVIFMTTCERMAAISHNPSNVLSVWSMTTAPTTRHNRKVVCTPTATAATVSRLEGGYTKRGTLKGVH